MIVAGSDATDHPDAVSRPRRRRRGRRRRRDHARRSARRADRARSHGPLDDVAGLCLRAPRRRPAPNAAARRSSATSTRCRVPAWDLVDVERYRAHLAAPARLLLDEHRRPRAAARITATGARSRSTASATRRARRSTSPTRSAWLKRTYRPDHLWIADDIFGLKPGWIEQFAALVAERGAAMPFKCLLRADRRHADAVARALARRRLPHGLDRRRVRLAAHSRRDGEGHARRADRDGDATLLHERRHRGRLLPAVRLSRRDARRHRADAADGPRAAGPTTSACRCRIRCPARRSTSASRRSSARSRTGSTPTTSR